MKTCHLPRIAVLCVSGFGLNASHAQISDTHGSDTTYQYISQTQAWVNGAMAHALTQSERATSMRMEVSFGSLDSRLRLAPCSKVEPYLPVGSRLWGKSRGGLRCLDGSVKWNVFLPVTVKAYGKAWVLNANIPNGTVLRSDDAAAAEVDFAEEASPALTDPSQWVGFTAARQLSSGQAIRQSSIRASNAFVAGAQVRIIAQGAGFSISTNGQALTAGSLGQSIRVKMESGRVVSGLVIDQHTVRIEL